MNRIKKDDEVYIIAGRDKGKRAKVLRILENNRAYIEGINMVTKHKKGDPQKGIEGGRVRQESSIDLSNVALWDPIAKCPSKVGIKTLEDGRKVRYFKKSNEVVDVIEKRG